MARVCRLCSAFGKLRATYEPAHTRAFKHGRTACIRSVSSASAAWVVAMNDPKATSDVKRALLTEAVVAHGNYTKLASQGQDVDRHLLGACVRACVLGMRAGMCVSSPSSLACCAVGARCRHAAGAEGRRGDASPVL